MLAIVAPASTSDKTGQHGVMQTFPNVANQGQLARRHGDDFNTTGRENTMHPNDNDDSRSAVLYWDFENLHAGLMEAK